MNRPEIRRPFIFTVTKDVCLNLHPTKNDSLTITIRNPFFVLRTRYGSYAVDGVTNWFTANFAFGQ